MVVYSNEIPVEHLDLAYIALFLGQRVNELVVDRLKRAGFKNVRQSHGYVMQHLIEEDRTISGLARRMEVTQQAASKTVAEMIRFGILEATAAQDRRAKTIRISKRGWESIRFSRRVRAGLDRRLATAVGLNTYGSIKSGLIACFAELGGVQRIKTRRVREPR